MRRAGAAELGLGVFLLTLPAVGMETETWRGTYPLGRTGAVAVENVQGSIRIDGWERSNVEVTVQLRAPELLPGVRVVVEREPNGLRFRTVHPHRSAPSDGRRGMQVDYHLRVPRQADLRLRTVAGNILLRDVEGAVDARSLEGSIEQVGLVGPVRARVLTGDIRVAVRRLPEPTASIHLETVNGTIFLQLPPHPHADLEVDTVAGRVVSPYWFPAGGKGEESGSRVRLGRGGARIWLRAVRGDIRVEERDDLL